MHPSKGEQLSSSGFKEDLAWCTWQENGPEAVQWFTDNLPSLNTKYTEALADFIKDPEGRNILRAEDGTPVPIFYSTPCAREERRGHSDAAQAFLSFAFRRFIVDLCHPHGGIQGGWRTVCGK